MALKFDQNAANSVCIQLGYTGTLHLPTVAETMTSGLMGLCVEIMHTVAWTSASATHSHLLLFSAILAML